MLCVAEQNLTDVVLDRWKAIPDPRLRQVTIRYDFVLQPMVKAAAAA